MMEFFRDFHFLRPWCLLFLIPIALLWLKKINISENLSSWSFVCDKKLLDFLLIKNKHKKVISFKTLIYMGLFCATIAASGPAWKKIDIPTIVPENPTMFLLSMAQEMQLTDISPSRLMRAKYAIVDIVQNVKNAQFGLEVYTTEPYVVSPITDDASIISNIMLQITPNIMPDFGDRADRAIELATQKLNETGFNNGNIILLASDIGYRLDHTLKSVEKARQMGFSVNVIDTSFDGSDKLELVAQKGGGIYLKLRENNLNLLINKLSDINKKRMLLNKNMLSDYLDFGYYLLIIPLLCILPLFRRGFLCLLAFLFTFNAEASFLLNNNQEAFSLFNQKKYDEAYKLFDSSLWKSISLYKQNKLEEALKDIEKEKDEKSLYNKGVILTKLCKYNDAKAVFEEVVRRFEDNEDAKFNLMAIEDLLVKANENPSLLECEDNSSGGSGGGDSDKNNKKNNNNNNNENNSEKYEENDNNNQKENSDKDSNDNEKDNSSNNDEQKNNAQNEQNNSDKQNGKDADNNQNGESENNNDNNSKKDDKKDQNNNNDTENKSNEKEQNEAEDKNDEDGKKTGVKNIKKESESESSDSKNDENKNEEKEDKNNKNNNEQNNNNDQNEENGESSKQDNKTDEIDNNNATQNNEESDKNKDGDSEKNKDTSEQNKNEKNKQDKNSNEGNNKKDDSNEKNSSENKKHSKPETNKEKHGNKSDDFDASDKLSDDKNDDKTGNIANIGDEVEKEKPIDEKELLMQRRYREIPDDVGGLLREMIKKEHFKGRYKNEKM